MGVVEVIFIELHNTKVEKFSKLISFKWKALVRGGMMKYRNCRKGRRKYKEKLQLLKNSSLMFLNFITKAVSLKNFGSCYKRIK